MKAAVLTLAVLALAGCNSMSPDKRRVDSVICVLARCDIFQKQNNPLAQEERREVALPVDEGQDSDKENP